SCIVVVPLRTSRIGARHEGSPWMMESVTPLPNKLADGARLEDRSKGWRAFRPPRNARHNVDEHAPPSISKHKKAPASTAWALVRL
ncbi:hypothetical protein, partial [Xanthomonas oryzae]|uniref:hypothetical protein n=2 Tax=Xanthomonas oryzae TaxID=347 RepID=UPI001C49E878